MLSSLVEYTEAVVERGILAAARMQGSATLPLDASWRLLDFNIIAIANESREEGDF